MFASFCLLFMPAGSALTPCVAGGVGDRLPTECWSSANRVWETIPGLALSNTVQLTSIQFGRVACVTGGATPSKSVICTNGTGWIPVSPLVISIAQASALSFQNGVFLMGSGSSQILLVNANSNDANVNNLGFTSSVNSNDFSPALANAAHFYWNGLSCLAGGLTGAGTSVVSTSCWNKSWIPNSGPSLTTARYGAATIQDGVNWCIVGGSQPDGTPLSTTECLAPADTKFNTFSSLPVPTSFLVNLTIEGASCVGGGQLPDGIATNNVYCLNGVAWSPHSRLNTARTQHVSFNLDSDLLTVTQSGSAGTNPAPGNNISDPTAVADPSSSPTTPHGVPTSRPTRAPFTLFPTRFPTTTNPTSHPTTSSVPTSSVPVPTSVQTPSPTTSPPMVIPPPTGAPTEAPSPLSLPMPTAQPTTHPTTLVAPSPSPAGCRSGSYMVNGACRVCPAGTYSSLDPTTSITITSCTPCPPGSYSHLGATLCPLCDPGLCDVNNRTSCQTCPAPRSCVWNDGVSQPIEFRVTSTTSFPFYSYSVTCNPNSVYYAALLPVNGGLPVYYTSALPLILPCGRHTIRLQSVPFSGSIYADQTSNNNFTAQTVLTATCPDSTVSGNPIVYEKFISLALNQTLAALQGGQLALGLQLGVVVTEGLALNPPTNLTIRRIFRANALAGLISVSKTYPDSPEIATLIRLMVAMTNELPVAASMDSLTSSTTPLTISNLQLTLTVLQSVPISTSAQDSNGILSRVDSLTDRIAELLASNTSNASFTVTTGSSTVIAQRSSADDFSAGLSVQIASSFPATTSSASDSPTSADTSTSTIGLTYPRSLSAQMSAANAPTIDCVIVSAPSTLLTTLTETQQPCGMAESMLSVACQTPDGQPFPIANLSAGDPLTITFPHRDVDLDYEGANCVFWDTQTGNLSTTGCTAENFPNVTICRCVHATIFSINFFPKPNVIRVADFDHVTPQNIASHPIPTVIACSFLGLFAVMAAWATYRDRREKDLDLRSAKAQARQENQGNSVSLLRAWWIEMRAQHLWISVLKRRFGDPFTSKQRLCCLASTLFISLTCNGLFFQSGTRSIPGSIASSLCAIALGFPLVIFFKRASNYGLPSDYFVTLKADETSPARKRSRNMRIVAYCLCFACITTCFIIIIVLGLQFDLGTLEPEVVGCFPILTFQRDKYSLDWLTRCLLSLIYDILLIRPFAHLIIVLMRRGILHCCGSQTKKNNDNVLVELPETGKQKTLDSDDENIR